jgi:hypothetical protein
LYSLFEVGEKLNALVAGYYYRGTVLEVLDDKYVVKLDGSNKTIETLKSQCFNCSFYWNKDI